jgi:hypothetical protein
MEEKENFYRLDKNVELIKKEKGNVNKSELLE